APLAAQEWRCIPSPGNRSGAAIAWDLVHANTVLFGGSTDGFDSHADTWTFDGASWTQQSPAVSPPARWNHALAHDFVRGRTVLFGGFSVLGGGWFADTWEWDGSTWVQVVTPTSPQARMDHALAYDAVLGRTGLFGGGTAFGTAFGDTWEYNGANWTAVATAAAPAPRRQHALAYDLARSRTVLFGGTTVADTWEYDGANWIAVTTATTPPPRNETV